MWLNQLPVLSLIVCAFTAVGCDIKLVGTDDSALVDLTPGPTQGTVRVVEDPTGESASTGVVEDPTGNTRSTSAAHIAAGLRDALDHLDEVRAQLGLSPLTLDPSLANAAEAHAAYVVQNNAFHVANHISPHLEVEGLPGFTGEKVTDRVEYASYDGIVVGEVIGYQQTATATMTAWLESLYHRLPLIRAETRDIGVGEARQADLTTHVVEVATTDLRVANIERFIVFPAPGATEVPTEWSGLEVPQPQAPPKGYPSGPVITLSAIFGEVAVEQVLVRRQGDDLPVPATVLSHDNDPHLQARDVAIIPHEALQPSTRYEIEVHGSHDGRDFVHGWHFVTRRAGCDIGVGACGPGRSCYAVKGEKRCLFEGAGAENDTCNFVDDCGEGLTCLGARCRPACEQGGAVDCESRCEGHGTIGTSVDGVDVCRDAPCSPDSCGDEQGCYWVGGLLCAWAGDLGRGESCSYANDCAPGLSCLGAGGGASRCYALCDVPGGASCAEVCADQGSIVLDEVTGLRACR